VSLKQDSKNLTFKEMGMEEQKREEIEHRIKMYQVEIETLEDISADFDRKIRAAQEKMFDLQYELKGKGG